MIHLKNKTKYFSEKGLDEKQEQLLAAAIEEIARI